MRDQRIAKLAAFYIAAVEQGRRESSEYLLREAQSTLDEMKDELQRAGFLKPFANDDGDLTIW